ncbi:hypothetical protein [Agromyces larvae]|uniref:Lipoprotein n=1 Tax=Agromyces larvae TaxID=2929802 RepID=A0ABY4C1Y9_9MICO|nr:hypothetical protein [Agromyces larvae]UOE44161.1 hypothetical protein MTO99_18715 [Agromyces larvae]
MTRRLTPGIAQIALIALLGTGLAGCAATAAGTDGPSTGATENEAPAQPADLVGEWVQSNKKSEESFQSATITADTIEVFWVSDGGNTKALYWSGTFETPTVSGPFSWDSQNDTEKTSGALLASGDPTKTFSFDNDTISYEVTALGVTTTVELKRQ